jgi:KDO2-lipid IV(A) lauroyltransferase
MIEGIEYFFFRMFQWMARQLSFRAAGRLGAFLGGLVFTATGFRKKITLDNLSHAFPELPREKIVDIARGAFRNYGTSILEMMWASGQTAGALLPTVRITNVEIVHSALQRGRGVILLSGHFGAWELIVHVWRQHIGRPLAIIVQHQRNRKIDEMVDRSRRRWGNITLPMGSSAREVLRVLHGNGIIAMLGDQSGPKESIFVDFFGRPAATHRGAAVFSLRTGAPIIMGVLVRQENGTYETTFEEVDRSGIEEYSEENVNELTRRHVKMLEEYIKRNPHHWLWMHKRWKHAPHYHETTDASTG